MQSAEEFDEEIIKDFLGELIDAYDHLKQLLSQFSKADSDHIVVSKVFRVLHSVKSNLRMMSLDNLSEVIHLLENTLEKIRDNKFDFVDEYDILILVVIAQVQELSKASLYQDAEPISQSLLYDQIDELTRSDAVTFQSKVHQAIITIDPNGQFHDPDDLIKVITPTTEQQNDLDYFVELSEQVEYFFPHWKERNQRTLNLCLKMNKLAGYPVDPVQLEGSVYMHDIGMSFVPYEVITSSEKLGVDSTFIMQNHCYLGFGWLNRLKNWQVAAEITYQHHERIDGTGYPRGLKGDEICAGAKIIAIANTFEAITQPRAHKSDVRPKMKALMEINKNRGSQFEDEWVERLNCVVKNDMN